MGSIQSDPVRSKPCVYTTPLKCKGNRVITWTCSITGVVWCDISLNDLKMASHERVCSLLLQKQDKNVGRALAMLVFTPNFAKALNSFLYTCLFLFKLSRCSWILCSPQFDELNNFSFRPASRHDTRHSGTTVKQTTAKHTFNYVFNYVSLVTSCVNAH